MLHQLPDKPEYWQAVASAIDAENTKASLFIKHAGSIGSVRERILRDFLRVHTPEPFRLAEGFVIRPYQDSATEDFCSQQLDIVVFNPMRCMPTYRIDDLSVIHHWSVNTVIEVKTRLYADDFKDAIDKYENVHWLAFPVLAFAYEGWAFDEFANRVSAAIGERRHGLPDCIAVHGRNYAYIRTMYQLNPNFGPHHRARFEVALDFGDQDGFASGLLLDRYIRNLTGQNPDGDIKTWFDRASRKVSFDHKGQRFDNQLYDNASNAFV